MRSAVRSSRLINEQALLNFQSTVADTLLSVSNAYDDVLRGAMQIEVRDASVTFLSALRDDLNTPQAIASLHQAEPLALAGGLGFLGFSNVAMKISVKPKLDEKEIADAIALRQKARAAKNFAESDRIRDWFLARGIVLKDGPHGTTWEVKR